MSADSAALLRAAAASLPGDTPRLDAELLLAHALGTDRLDLLARPRALAPAAVASFEALLARRRAHEPVAYLLGRREFWSLDLVVTQDVLIPRPDSETLVAAAIEALAARPPRLVLDLGTGSGALLLAALAQWPAAQGLGTDLSLAAVRVARANAQRLGLAGRARFAVADWGAALDVRVDLLLCNPPYVAAGAHLPPDVARFEPETALYAGPDGLGAFRRLIPALPGLLAGEGIAVVEVGDGQAGAVLALAADTGLEGVVRADLGGRARALVLRRGKGLGKSDPSI